MNKHAYTLKETAETLGLSLPTVEGLVRKGEIQTIHIGSARRVTHRQLDEFLLRAERDGIIPTARSPRKE